MQQTLIVFQMLFIFQKFYFSGITELTCDEIVDALYIKGFYAVTNTDMISHACLHL